MSHLYKQAGLDIDAGQRRVELMKESVRATFQEAYRIFNMGMGLVLLIDATYEAAIGALLPETVCIGQLVKQEGIAPSVRLLEASVSARQMNRCAFFDQYQPQPSD